MSKNVKYRLCGGTFFTLLLNDRQPLLSKFQNYSGESSGLSEPDLLLALTSIVHPDVAEKSSFVKKSLVDGTHKFKACINWGLDSFQLGNKSVQKTFDERIKNHYNESLSAMIDFTKKFLYIKSSTKKDEYLIKALVEVLNEDDSIDDSQEFFVCANGKTMTKSEICSAHEIDFQSFLLGIWHYVITVVPNNTIGQDTYNEWCPPNNRSKREYVKTIGENSSRNITLKYCEGYNMKTENVIEVADNNTTQENISESNNRSYQQNLNVTNVAQAQNSQDDKSKPSDDKVSGNVVNNIHNGDKYAYVEVNNGTINL